MIQNRNIPKRLGCEGKKKRNVNVILCFKHVTVALTNRHVIGGFPFREHIWYITRASECLAGVRTSDDQRAKLRPAYQRQVYTLL